MHADKLPTFLAPKFTQPVTVAHPLLSVIYLSTYKVEANNLKHFEPHQHLKQRKDQSKVTELFMKRFPSKRVD